MVNYLSLSKASKKMAFTGQMSTAVPFTVRYLFSTDCLVLTILTAALGRCLLRCYSCLLASHKLLFALHAGLIIPVLYWSITRKRNQHLPFVL